MSWLKEICSNLSSITPPEWCCSSFFAVSFSVSPSSRVLIAVPYYTPPPPPPNFSSFVWVDRLPKIPRIFEKDDPYCRQAMQAAVTYSKYSSRNSSAQIGNRIQSSQLRVELNEDWANQKESSDVRELRWGNTPKWAKWTVHARRWKILSLKDSVNKLSCAFFRILSALVGVSTTLSWELPTGRRNYGWMLTWIKAAI